MNPEKIGILLTAGGQEKVLTTHLHINSVDLPLEVRRWIEPDLEGKVRSLGAIEALKNGQINKLYVLGGQQAHGEPISQAYYNYLQKFINRNKLSPDQIVRLPGAADTLTDLERATKTLTNEELKKLIIFSSGFHIGRAKLIMKAFGFKVGIQATEDLARQRSRRHSAVITRILNPAFTERMNQRELKLKLLLLPDILPGLNRFRFGYQLTRFLSTSQRRGE